MLKVRYEAVNKGGELVTMWEAHKDNGEVFYKVTVDYRTVYRGYELFKAVDNYNYFKGDY